METFFGKNKLFALSFVGEHPIYKWALCFDLKNDPLEMEKMSEQEFNEYLTASPKVIRNLKLNKSPIILDFEKINKLDINSELDEKTIYDRYRYLENNNNLKRRILDFYSKKNIDISSNISQEDIFAEETIYKRFTNNNDAKLMEIFHSSNWEEKVKIKNKFRDERLIYFANLMIYEEQPQFLEKSIISSDYWMQ